MTIFISWSGDRSRFIAEALHEWLPNVIQSAQPWMSARDIEKGRRWDREIAGRLEQAKFGIACVTPENTEAPWLLFESGALAKSIEDAYLWTYLYGLEPRDLRPPLGDFQATKADEADTKKMVETINTCLEGPLDDAVLGKAFEKWWPDLKAKLDNVPATGEPAPPNRSVEDVLEEVLQRVRELGPAVQQIGDEQRRKELTTFDSVQIRQAPQPRRVPITVTQRDGPLSTGVSSRLIGRLIEQSVRRGMTQAKPEDDNARAEKDTRDEAGPQAAAPPT